jgi:Mg-chelatase subunit ChlD
MDVLNRIRTLLLAALLVITATSLAAGNKSTYDLMGPDEGQNTSLHKTASLSGDRVTLSRVISAATIVDGGFFTIGTTGGTTTSALDDNCTITYGHPYAKTSYPVVCIDGTWGKPGQFFQTTGSYPRASGDSIILVYTLPQKYELRFTLWLESGGAKIHVMSSLKNLDAISHSFGLGLIFDPALGTTGDGFVKLGVAPLVRDTLIAAQSIDTRPLTITERSSSAYGLKIGLAFPSDVPSTFIAANWDDVVNNDTPSFTPSDVRELYDAVLKFFWAPQTIAPNATLAEETVVTVMDPNFGSGAFLRWDVPTSQSVENGAPFPKQFSSRVSVRNIAQAVKNLLVQVVPPAEVQTSPASVSMTTAPQATGFGAITLTFKELYENKVVDMLLLCKENNVVIDSLVKPFRICATPVSDTGLTVRIDSLIKSPSPKVAFTFDVTKQSTRQNILNLSRDNIFCYENGLRITDYTLGKDTTGGAGAIDLVFVLDVTGSMTNSIEGVKNNIKEFADSLSARGVNFRLGLVTFLDIVENVFDFTSDVQKFKTTVAAQFAHGGGDSPENSLDALYRASEMTFRDNAKKVFIWITDETYHEKDQFTTRVRLDVVNRLLSMDVTVHAIGTLSYQTDWYSPFTQATGGNYYNINGNFRDILLDIGNLRGTNRYLLSYASPLSQTTQREIRLTVHYAGLGGSTTTTLGSTSPSIAPTTLSCFPNPFNPQTTIRFHVPAGAHGTLTIHNILGQSVRSFALTGISGTSDLVWNARDDSGHDVATGLYFLRCTLYSETNQLLSSETAKLLFLK